ncbi:MAG TPA: MFS transporter [Gaiellaceae bacterium]|nr:MFS transporter [Gaiellaceae bacterium]
MASERTLPSRASLRLVPRGIEESFHPPVRGLMWALGLGAFGLAWSITTVAAYLPPLLREFTASQTLIGLVLAAEGVFAFFMPLLIGPMSDATQLPLGRRRPYMVLALAPMAVCLVLLPFMPGFQATALALFGFFFAYYIYEPPYRGLYPDRVPQSYFGRAQGIQHVLRGLALGAALVGGGFLLSVWEPFPFVLAAGVTLVSCAAVVVLVSEERAPSVGQERFRSILSAPWRVVRREKNVRRFLIANSAWEATFAGMRTFVVLYIIDGLDQPLYVSSTVLGVVAAGYVAAAIAAGRFGDEFGVGNVILGASVVYGLGLLVAGFAQTWHWWYYGLIAPVAMAGGVVMTLAWALLFKLMPERDRGTITGLATTTKGIGLVVGPLVAGGAIDIFHDYFRSTDGYAVIWPVVAIPVLAVIPLVALLAEAEGSVTSTGTRPVS